METTVINGVTGKGKNQAFAKLESREKGFYLSQQENTLNPYTGHSLKIMKADVDSLLAINKETFEMKFNIGIYIASHPDTTQTIEEWNIVFEYLISRYSPTLEIPFNDTNTKKLGREKILIYMDKIPYSVLRNEKSMGLITKIVETKGFDIVLIALNEQNLPLR